MKKKEIPFYDPESFVENLLTEGFKEKYNYDELKKQHDIIIFRSEETVPYLKIPVHYYRSSFNVIIFLRDGYSQRHSGLQEYTLKRNVIYFLPENQVSSVTYVSHDIKGFICLFNSDFIFSQIKNNSYFEQFPFFQLDGNPIINLTDEEANDMEVLFEQMLKEYKEESNEKKNIMSNYLQLIFLKSKRSYSKNITTESSKNLSELNITKKFKDLVTKYSLEHKSVNEYAEILSITPNHLNRCVKNVTGKSASKLIIEMSMIEAKIMLKYTDYTISEIAEKLNYYDLAYFSRLFKKYNGVNPTDFKNNA